MVDLRANRFDGRHGFEFALLGVQEDELFSTEPADGRTGGERGRQIAGEVREREMLALRESAMARAAARSKPRRLSRPVSVSVSASRSILPARSEAMIRTLKSPLPM